MAALSSGWGRCEATHVASGRRVCWAWGQEECLLCNRSAKTYTSWGPFIWWLSSKKQPAPVTSKMDAEC
jgi:hypothetical protein